MPAAARTGVAVRINLCIEKCFFCDKVRVCGGLFYKCDNRETFD